MLNRFPRCSDIAHHASDYTDRTMTWSQSLGYSAHLLLCGHCRTFLRHLRSTITYARALPEKEVLSEDKLNHIVNLATQADESKS